MQTIQMTAENTFTTEARGVSYFLRLDGAGRWELRSHRKALGRMHIGLCRHFATLAEVGAQVKAFRGIDALVSA